MRLRSHIGVAARALPRERCCQLHRCPNICTFRVDEVAFFIRRSAYCCRVSVWKSLSAAAVAAVAGGPGRVVVCVCVAAAELLWLTVLRRPCGCCVFCVAAAALRWLTVLRRPCGCCCCWKSVDLVVELNRPAAMCSRTGAAGMMVATGAQVRLFRRGAAQPVGVRWAAPPIACAGSVQAVAKRQRCLRHRWNQVLERKCASKQHRRGAPNTTGGHRHTGLEPTAGVGQQAPSAGGHNIAGRGAPRGAQHRGGHQHTRGPLPPANIGRGK